MKNVTHTVIDDETPKAMMPAALRLDPDWDRARELLSEGRQTAIQLAHEIERLKELYMQPAGLRRGSKSQTVIQNNDGGFQAKLSSELNLHPQQAARILESASYQSSIIQVADAELGEIVTYTSSKGKEEHLEVTPEAQSLARQAVDEWGMPYSPRPSRQWAGIAGGAETRGKDRNPVDSAKQVRNALRSLEVHLPRWDSFSPEDQALIAGVAKQISLGELLEPLMAAAARSKVEAKR
jgi:hypothetical protein